MDLDARVIPIAPIRWAEFDLEAVENPVLMAVLVQARSGESRPGRSFNNFVS
ncbi:MULTISPECIES: hypothetical protein [Actinoplanes]|uniref:hypothetical protein n=1 Tax=Actinoplanes TaxID=1865 RepID=UPI0012FB7B12|nr:MULTISPECIES: hypothetical protein [Actinoplanes]